MVDRGWAYAIADMLVVRQLGGFMVGGWLTQQMIGPFFYAAVVTLYLCVSRRVRNTYLDGPTEQELTVRRHH